MNTGPANAQRIIANNAISASWQASPYALVFSLFFLVPLALIVMVSFWQSGEYTMTPAFTFQNYIGVFEGCGNTEELCVTLKTYLSTIKFSLIVWFITLVLGFALAYFLAFHVRSPNTQMLLFVLCTIPFWTSNVIRMISWIPLLGRNGLVNQTLQSMGFIDKPTSAFISKIENIGHESKSCPLRRDFVESH